MPRQIVPEKRYYRKLYRWNPLLQRYFPAEFFIDISRCRRGLPGVDGGSKGCGDGSFGYAHGGGAGIGSSFVKENALGIF